MQLHTLKNNARRGYPHMKIIFAGTPDFAAVHLQKLIDSKADICAVLTQPDRPKGRGHHLAPSPVKEVALQAGIPVYQPEKLRNNDEAIQTIRELNADLMIVVAYGLILPDEVIFSPRLGSINVHGSILPRWRGAAPIQRSLWAGDAEAGVTIMKVAPELDSGDIIRIASVPITGEDTSLSLYEKLAELGAATLCEMMPNIEELLGQSIPQDPALVTYAKKLTKEEAVLDFSLDAETLERYVRTYIPWPLACFTLDGNTIKVHKAAVLREKTERAPGEIVKAGRDGLDIATANGILRITELQLPNKKAMPFADVFNSKKEMFSTGRMVNS